MPWISPSFTNKEDPRSWLGFLLKLMVRQEGKEAAVYLTARLA